MPRGVWFALTWAAVLGVWALVSVFPPLVMVPLATVLTIFSIPFSAVLMGGGGPGDRYMPSLLPSYENSQKKIQRHINALEDQKKTYSMDDPRREAFQGQIDELVSLMDSNRRNMKARAEMKREKALTKKTRKLAAIEERRR